MSVSEPPRFNWSDDAPMSVRVPADLKRYIWESPEKDWGPRITECLKNGYLTETEAKELRMILSELRREKPKTKFKKTIENAKILGLIVISFSMIFFGIKFLVNEQKHHKATLPDGGPYIAKVEWFVSDESTIPYKEGEFTVEAYLKNGCFIDLKFLSKKKGLKFDTSGGSKLCVDEDGVGNSYWGSGDYEFRVDIIGRAMNFEVDIDGPTHQTKGGD